MIIVRAPLRITFIGDATDIRDFYSRTPGRVISTTIDKFIYLAINPKYIGNKFIMKYSVTESVQHPSELKHEGFRTALLDYGIVDNGIEIASFADIPAKTGLGSSSSFSVALIKGLNAHLGKTISKEDAAAAACRLEIDLMKQPIGKQDQYAAAYGGFNIIQFNPDESVDVEPVLLDFQKRSLLENHLLLFFTGMTRDAGSVLTEQKSIMDTHFETYKKMAESVGVFHEKLLAGDVEAMGALVHEEWERKRGLASNVSNEAINALYEKALEAGAWGGKVMGAGNGGCIMLLAPLEKHQDIRQSLQKIAESRKLNDFQEIPIRFTQSGTDILFNSNGHQ